jgi:hypothetical protein
VIERLVLVRTHVFGDRKPPLFGVVELRINVENHAAEREDPMADNLTDLKFGGSRFDHALSIDHDDGGC